MSFLTIHGHEIPVEHENADVEKELIGDARRAFSGKMLSTHRNNLYKWSFTTSWLVELEWRFLIALLHGEGHHWSFDSSSEWKYSSKGLGPTSGTAANGSRYTGSTKFGAAAVGITAGAQLQFNLGYTAKWTVMVWKYSGSVWNHYAVNNAGNKWVDGVQNDATSTPFITVNGSGNLLLGDTGSGATQYFDDLVVIPEKINDSWASDLGVATYAFSDLPLIRVNGNLTLSDAFYVRGFDAKVSLTQAYVSGTWEPNLGKVTATLIEDSRV